MYHSAVPGLIRHDVQSHRTRPAPMSARTLLWKKDGRPTSMAIRSASMSANNPPFERDRSMRFIAKAFPGRRNKLLRVLYKAVQHSISMV
jgi:hypothetical protein